MLGGSVRPQSIVAPGAAATVSTSHPSPSDREILSEARGKEKMQKECR